MPSFDCYRSLQSFNVILDTLFENGRFDDADEMFKSCSKMGFRPNAMSFNIMLKGWLGKGDWDEVRKGKKPNVVSYALLMEALCSIGEFKEAKKMTFDMEYQGCRPRLVNYRRKDDVKEQMKKENWLELDPHTPEKQSTLKPLSLIHAMVKPYSRLLPIPYFVSFLPQSSNSKSPSKPFPLNQRASSCSHFQFPLYGILDHPIDQF
ncbi:hypothetical protein L1987_39654 [Smallanthus sonchifolius]|uniref:Uncharacterized protein n=1 Tax=Smallanthus sonchifolius TaxID=185202 RepID=A0ACB9HMW3_9ASTR|nr:hypothetical protein L1987_39654 [Smallanthus sonchifolius]